MHAMIVLDSKTYSVHSVHRVVVAVADSNLLVAETNAESDVSVPVAEWLSQVVTPSQESGSRQACLLFDLHLNKDVFHRVSFEITCRSADVETVRKRRLFSVSNDGHSDRVKDTFDFTLDDAVSHYQVTTSPMQSSCVAKGLKG